MTAVLAIIGALIGYESGSAQNESMILKNKSILKQAQASDQWGFLPSQRRQGIYRRCDRGSSGGSFCEGALRGSRAKESAEKDAVRAQAERPQAQSRKLGEESEAKLRPHEQLALALTFLQIALALAVITVVTRRRWLLLGSGAAISAMPMR